MIGNIKILLIKVWTNKNVLWILDYGILCKLWYYNMIYDYDQKFIKILVYIISVPIYYLVIFKGIIKKISIIILSSISNLKGNISISPYKYLL